MKKIITSLFTLLSTSAFADFHCTVDVNRVLAYSNGTVNILHTGRGDYTHICNLKIERQGVSITTCAMWTSMLQNIQNNSTKAIFYYEGTGTCATLPTYQHTPAPVYIGTVK